jgi:DNA mismatch endonuclease, patch repair protein
MDTLSPAERSVRMSLVRSKDTKPEIVVRRLAHAQGYRFRLHVRDLPGCPDLVFPKYWTVIFVHGCFWHQHRCSLGNRMPKSRLRFWRPKLEGNANRDRRNVAKLRAMGWRVLIVWECQTKEAERLALTIRRFLVEP